MAQNKLSEISQELGVSDIEPFTARGYFARALQDEREHGQTTPLAEEYLAKAIAALK